MRDFRQLNIWRGSIALATQIYESANAFPTIEIYGLSRQMQRASVSIASNIAEGSSRSSETEFARFLEISIGSAFEIETQLIIANELKYVNDDKMAVIIGSLHDLQKQINQLITVIRKKKHQS